MNNSLKRKIVSVEITLLKDEFGAGKNTKIIEGLACDVHVEKAGFPSRNICRIGIFGLRMQDIAIIRRLLRKAVDD